MKEKNKILEYNCPECNIKFTSELSFRKHLHKVHNWNREQCHTFIHKDCIQLYCLECGKPTKFHKDHYQKFCNKNCCIKYLSKSKEVQKHREETNLKLYGYKNAMQNKDIKNKFRDNYFEKTGFINPSQNPIVSNKKKETCKKNSGYDNPAKNPLVRKKMDENWFNKTGYYGSARDPNIRKKMNSHLNIVDENGKKFHSKDEKEIYDLLKLKFKDVRNNYYSDKYPYQCDFYIPELDLYIEYQGTWHHGKEPFNKDNIIHLNTINEWKNKNTIQYNRAIVIWTIEDVAKREMAKKNHLNWLEFFNMKEFINWFNNQ